MPDFKTMIKGMEEKETPKPQEPINSQDGEKEKMHLHIPSHTPTAKELDKEVTDMFSSREEADKWLEENKGGMTEDDIANVKARYDKAFGSLDYTPFKKFITKGSFPREAYYYESPNTKYVKSFPTEQEAYDAAYQEEQTYKKQAVKDAEQFINDYKEGKIDRKNLAKELRNRYNREYVIEALLDKLIGK